MEDRYFGELVSFYSVADVRFSEREHYLIGKLHKNNRGLLLVTTDHYSPFDLLLISNSGKRTILELKTRDSPYDYQYMKRNDLLFDAYKYDKMVRIGRTYSCSVKLMMLSCDYYLVTIDLLNDVVSKREMKCLQNNNTDKTRKNKEAVYFNVSSLVNKVIKI